MFYDVYECDPDDETNLKALCTLPIDTIHIADNFARSLYIADKTKAYVIMHGKKICGGYGWSSADDD